jgi:Domain of unknown function (DUF3883)
VLLANADIEHAGIEYVMRLERQAGRQPEDVHHQGFPYDVSSPPRKIEVKAFGGSARGAPIPIEDSQVTAAREDPEHFYVYVVDNLAAADQTEIAVRVLYGSALQAMLGKAAPHVTYWPTLRTSHYDKIVTGVSPEE